MDERLRKRFKLLSIILGVLIGLSIGTAIGITIISLPTEYITLYQGSYADSHFRIDSFTTHASSDHQITIQIKLTNTDTETHSANVTVILYDDEGEILAQATQNTGDVDGGHQKTLVFHFTVDVEEYDHPFIEVHDTS